MNENTPLSSLHKDDPLKYWRAFGFEAKAVGPVGLDITCTLPEGVLVLSGANSLDDALKRLPAPPKLLAMRKDRRYAFYRVAPGFILPDDLGKGVKVYKEGDHLYLTNGSDFRPHDYYARSIAELSLLDGDVAAPNPVVTGSPLAAFSLRGQAEQFEKMAVESKPLLGELCFSGEATVWFAPPNAGKTLIGLNLVIDAVTSGRIEPGNVYYINADDSSAGFTSKLRLLDDLGVHTLAPGYKGFKSERLVEIFQEVAALGKARGVLIVIDTIKKFTSLMDKNKASAFANACRQISMQGGTVLGFAHTAKSPSTNGKLRYAGTTDIVDDFDAAYIMTPADALTSSGERVVMFDCIKRRGNNPLIAAYAYAHDAAISYDERLASVRPVDPDQLEEFQRVAAERVDADIIDAIKVCIGDDITNKMALAKAAAKKANASERAAIRVLEAYTGTDPEQHHWTYSVGDRGAKMFTLLTPATPDTNDQPHVAA